MIVALTVKPDEPIGLPSTGRVAINPPASQMLNRPDFGKRFPFDLHSARPDFTRH